MHHTSKRQKKHNININLTIILIPPKAQDVHCLCWFTGVSWSPFFLQKIPPQDLRIPGNKKWTQEYPKVLLGGPFFRYRRGVINYNPYKWLKIPWVNGVKFHLTYRGEITPLYNLVDVIYLPATVVMSERFVLWKRLTNPKDPGIS